MQNLVKAALFERIKTAQAAGTSTITSDAVDTQGYQAVTFIVAFGAIVAGAATSIKLQQSSDDGSSDAYADLEGTSITVADDDDDKMAIIEINNPRERYLKLIVSRATQNSTVDGIFAIKHRHSGALPVTQASADVVAAGVEVHNSPAEGTA